MIPQRWKTYFEVYGWINVSLHQRWIKKFQAKNCSIKGDHHAERREELDEDIALYGLTLHKTEKKMLKNLLAGGIRFVLNYRQIFSLSSRHNKWITIKVLQRLNKIWSTWTATYILIISVIRKVFRFTLQTEGTYSV